LEGQRGNFEEADRLIRQALKIDPAAFQAHSNQAAAAAPNVLERSFQATAPNRKWIADFTNLWTAEGWLYVAAAPGAGQSADAEA
jgi:putative transposase